MRINRRLLATGVALLVPALIQWRWTSSVRSPGARPLQPPALPSDVGPWSASMDDAFSANVVDRLGVDSYALRLYEGPDRVPVWIYVGMYPGFGDYGAKYHSPETCYPAQGWETVDYRPLEIAVSHAETLHAKAMSLQRVGKQQEMMYWFQPAERWPRARALEELLRVLDAVMGRPQYAFVRLSTPAADGPAARRDLHEFAASIAPAIRSAVDRGSAWRNERTARLERGPLLPAHLSNDVRPGR